MLFSFKEQIDDFIVEEILSFSLDGTGDFFYVFFEKKSENTMEIVNLICKEFKLERKHLGIAGLKDKDGVTRQRLSISKKYLKQIGGEKEFLHFLGGIVFILKTCWHSEPLAIGKNKGNRFTIRLRNKNNLSFDLKSNLEEKLSSTSYFPNTFGIQRFGKGNKNYKKALKLFQSEENLGEKYEVKFKLQAFGSMRFNEQVMRRWENKDFLLEGDIMVNGWNAFGTQVAKYQENKLIHFDYRKEKEEHIGDSFREAEYPTWTSDFNQEVRFPTGAVLGSEQLLCSKKTDARKYDDEILQESGFLNRGAEISKRYHLYGFRRPLWIKPQDFERKWDNGDLILNFFLPTGCYASSFLANLLGDIDPKGCIENNLIIPRPIEYYTA